MKWFRAALSTAFAAVLLVAPAAPPTVHITTAAAETSWTSSWNSALAYAPQSGPWDNETLRMIARTSAGGTSLRIHLSQAFSPQAAQIGHVTVGTQLNGGTTVETTPTTVTFGGAQAVTVPAGGQVVSDPVTFTVAPNTRLLISVYVATGAHLVQASRHDMAGETEYNYNGGDVSASQYYPTSNSFAFTTLLDGIDVSSTTPATVVAVGDSITDGNGSPTDTDTRWPNYVANRVVGSGLAVIDQGVSGNWVTTDQGSAGQSLQHRWQRDVLGQPGVRTVIDADGINDLIGGVSATALEQAQASLVASAHAAGVRVLLSTITPCEGYTACTTAVETQRLAYNAWVRTNASGADDFVDFDLATAVNEALKGAYNSGDHLHPDAAGAAAMANAIDVSKL